MAAECHFLLHADSLTHAHTHTQPNIVNGLTGLTWYVFHIKIGVAVI